MLDIYAQNQNIFKHFFFTSSSSGQSNLRFISPSKQSISNSLLSSTSLVATKVRLSKQKNPILDPCATLMDIFWFVSMYDRRSVNSSKSHDWPEKITSVIKKKRKKKKSPRRGIEPRSPAWHYTNEDDLLNDRFRPFDFLSILWSTQVIFLITYNAVVPFGNFIWRLKWTMYAFQGKVTICSIQNFVGLFTFHWQKCTRC